MPEKKVTVGRPVIIEFDGRIGLLRYLVRADSPTSEDSYEERWFWNDPDFRTGKNPTAKTHIDNLALSFTKNEGEQTQYAEFSLPFGIKWLKVGYRPPQRSKKIEGFDYLFDPDKDFVFVNEVLGIEMNITEDSFVKIGEGEVYFIPQHTLHTSEEKLFTNLAGFDLQNHQNEIRNKVRKGTRFKLLQHGMGTGKTISALAVIEELLMRKFVSRFVVVVPDALTAEWENEIVEQGYNHIIHFITFTTYSEVFSGAITVDAVTGLLFDEMHRLFSQMNTVVESRISLQRTKIDQANFLLGKDYRDMYNAFQNITAAGALFGLTGTPIFSDIYDVAFLINLFSRCETGFDAYPDNKFEFYENCMTIDEARLKLLQTYQMLSTDLGTTDGVRQSINDNFVDTKSQLATVTNQVVPTLLSTLTSGLLPGSASTTVLWRIGETMLWNRLFKQPIGPKTQSGLPPRQAKEIKVGQWNYISLEGEEKRAGLIDFNLADWALDLTTGGVAYGVSSALGAYNSYTTTQALSKFAIWYKDAKDNWLSHSQVFGQIKNIVPIVNYVDYFDVRDKNRNLKEDGSARFPSIIYKTVRVSMDIYSIRMHMIRKRDEILKWGSNKDLAVLTNLRAIYGADDQFQNVEVYLQIRKLSGEMITNLDDIGGLSNLNNVLRKAIGLDDMSISLCTGEDCDPQRKGGVLNLKLKLPGYLQLLFASHIAYLSEDFSLTVERGCNKAKVLQEDGTIVYKRPFYEIYGCTSVNRNHDYCTPWIRYIMFSRAYTEKERLKLEDQLKTDISLNIQNVTKLENQKLKLEFKHVKYAEMFHNMFKDIIHPSEPFKILLGERDTEQRNPITIDKAKVTIKNIVSHMSASITPIDLKRISSLPCPQRIKYPYSNKFYALFYNFLLDGDLTQNANLDEDKRGDLVISVPTLERSNSRKTTIVNVCEAELFQTILIEKDDATSEFPLDPDSDPLPLDPDSDPPPLDPVYKGPGGRAIKAAKKSAHLITASVAKTFDLPKDPIQENLKGKKIRRKTTFYDHNISPLCAVYSQYIHELGGILTLRDFLLRQDLSARNRNVYMYRGENFWTVADHIALHRSNTPNSSTSLVWPKDFKRVEKLAVKTTDYVFSVLGVPEKHLKIMDEENTIYDKYLEQKQINENVKIKDIRIDENLKAMLGKNPSNSVREQVESIWDINNPNSVASFEGERITMREWNLLKDPFKNASNRLKGIDLGGGRKVQLSLLLINRQATEGLSISNLRQIHVLEPIEDAGQFHQVIARGARTGSHGICKGKGNEVNERCSNMYIQAITWYSCIPQQHGFVGVYKLPTTTFNMFAKIMRRFAETHLYAQSFEIEKNDLGFGRVAHAVRKFWGRYIYDDLISSFIGMTMRFVERKGSYMFGFDKDDDAETFDMSEFKLRTKYRTFANDSYNELQDMLFNIMKTTLFHTCFFETSDDVAARNFVRSNKQTDMYAKINQVISCGVYDFSKNINKCSKNYPEFNDFDYLDCKRGVDIDNFKDTYRGGLLETPELGLTNVFELDTDSRKDRTRSYAFIEEDIGKNCKVALGRVKIDHQKVGKYQRIDKARVHPELLILEGEIKSVQEIEKGKVVVQRSNLGEQEKEYKRVKKELQAQLHNGNEELKKVIRENLKSLYNSYYIIEFENTFINYNNKQRYFDTLVDMNIHMNSFDNVSLYEYMPESMANKHSQTILYPFGTMKDDPDLKPVQIVPEVIDAESVELDTGMQED